MNPLLFFGSATGELQQEQDKNNGATGAQLMPELSRSIPAVILLDQGLTQRHATQQEARFLAGLALALIARVEARRAPDHGTVAAVRILIRLGRMLGEIQRRPKHAVERAKARIEAVSGDGIKVLMIETMEEKVLIDRRSERGLEVFFKNKKGKQKEHLPEKPQTTPSESWRQGEHCP